MGHQDQGQKQRGVTTEMLAFTSHNGTGTMVLPPNARIYDAKMQDKTMWKLNKSMQCMWCKYYAIMQLPTLFGPSTFNDLGYRFSHWRHFKLGGALSLKMPFCQKWHRDQISVFLCVNVHRFSFSCTFCWWCWNGSPQSQIITTIHNMGDSRSAQFFQFLSTER